MQKVITREAACWKMKSQKDLGVSLQTLTIPTKSHFIKAFVEKKKNPQKYKNWLWLSTNKLKWKHMRNHYMFKFYFRVLYALFNVYVRIVFVVYFLTYCKLVA